MKKIRLLPITLIALMGLSACGNQGSSKQDTSSEQPVVSSSDPEESSSTTPSSSDDTQYGVEITNKDELTKDNFFAGMSREMTIDVTPAGNVMLLINKGELKIESSDPSVLLVNGVNVAALKGGKATITVTYHNATDSVEITTQDEMKEPDKKQATVKEILAELNAETQKSVIYLVDAYITGWQSGKTDATKYGNFMIGDTADAKAEDQILVYGSSPTGTITWGTTSYSNEYDNQDFLTHEMTKDAMIGAQVKLEMIGIMYNDTKELSGIVKSLTNPKIVDATSVTLNKEALTIETGSSETLKATVEPADCNQKATWTSSDTNVATVNDQGLVIGVAEGEATITVAYGEVKATCTVTVVTPDRIFVTADTPVDGAQYKFGLVQGNLGKKLFATGVIANNYGVTTEEFNEGALLELVAVEGGYNAKFTLRDKSVKYMNLVAASGGKYINVKFDDAASSVWTWNTEYKTLVTEISGLTGEYESKNGTYYVGTYNNYNTLSPSKIDKAATSFVGQLYQEKVLGPVKPVVGEKYPFVINQANLGKTLYATGAVSGNYGVSSADAADAAMFELVAVEGGYNVKVTLADKETVKYFNVTTSNNGKTGKDAKTYVNAKFEDTASTVWKYDDNLQTIVVEINSFTGDYASGNDTYYFGTYSSYETLSFSKTSYAATSFVGHFYGETLVAPMAAPLATAITLDKVEAEILEKQTLTLKASLTPEDSEDLVTWNSSDTNIATVDQTGKVTGVAEGNATITAFIDANGDEKVDETELKATCNVKVIKNDSVGASVTVTTEGLPTAYGTDVEVTFDDVKFSFTKVANYGNGIQIQNKADAELHNKDAFAAGLKEVTINFHSNMAATTVNNQTATKGCLYVVFSASADFSDAETVQVQCSTSKAETTTTICPTMKDAKYAKVCSGQCGAVYCNSIVFTY